MLRYLSEEWLAEAGSAVSTVMIDPPVPEPGFAIVTRVTGVPGHTTGTVEYRVVFEGATASLLAGGEVPEGVPGVRFTQTFRTAQAVAEGQLSAQAAFMSGDIQLGGEVSAILSHAGLMTRVGDCLAELRARTTFVRPEPI